MTAMTHGKEQTAAQRGGEAKDKDKPLSDLQRDRYASTDYCIPLYGIEDRVNNLIATKQSKAFTRGLYVTLRRPPNACHLLL